MKKVFFHKWWSLLIFIAIIALVMGGLINQFSLQFTNNNDTSTEEKIQENEEKIQENNENEDMLSIKQMEEDLQSVKSSVLSHPYFKNDSLKEEYNKYFEVLINKIDKPMSNEDFYFIVNEALTYLKDSHTFVQPCGEENKEIPLNFIWLYNNDMVVKDDNEYLKKGDKILSINGKTPEQILDELRSLTSADNDYWIKVLGEKRLTMEMYLNRMQLVENEQVSMKVEHIDGKVEDVNLSLIQKTDNSDRVNNKREKNYEIFPDKNIGVIYIDNEVNYINVIKNFFKAVKENNITRIAVDIRKLSGGPYIINELLSYINVNKVKFPVEESNIDQGFERTINHKDTDLFKGKIYILTSKYTFSWESMLADIFKSNKLGLIVGEPTGNAPNFYGHTGKRTLLNSKIKYMISSIAFISPSEDTSINSVQPNVVVCMTREDIVSGNDPVIEWIINDK